MSRDRWFNHPCEALSALVDGELPAGGQRAAVEAHLGGCPVCRVLKEDIELLGQVVAAETPPPMPADLAARIRGRIDESAAARRAGWWRMPWRVPMPAAAAAAVVVVALVWLVSFGSRPPDTPIPATEVASRTAPGTTDGRDATGGPDVAGGRDAAGVPRSSPPALAPAPARAQPPAPAPAPIVGSAAAAREKPEPKLARSTPAGDAAAGRSNQAPPVVHRDDGVRPTPAGAIAEHDETRLYKETAKDTIAVDTERDRTQVGFLEATARQEAPAKPTTKASNAPPAAAPGMPASAGARPVVTMSDARIAAPPLEAAPYMVRLLPDGSMSVRARDYQCVVPIAPDDARLLASIGDATTAGVAPRTRAPEAATTGATASAAMEEPLPVVPSPEARSAILRLVRERYRAIIEERCGPLPR